MDAPGRLRGRAIWIVVACLVCQMGLGYGYVFGPLAIDILEEFGWTRAVYSGARAPQLFVIALASPLVGYATVRLGGRAVLSGSALLLGATFVGLGRMQEIWQLYALVVLQGLCVAGLGDIAVGQVVSQWVTRARGTALGIVYTGSNLGGWLLSRVAAGIADESSWRTAVSAIGLGGLVVMLPFAALVVREPHRPGGDAAPAEAPDPMRDAAAEPEHDALPLRRALRTRSFWILAATLFSFFFYFIGMLEHLVLFLTDTGMPRQEATAHYSNAILLGLVSKVAYGFVADRMSNRAAILLDYALIALSSLLLLTLPSAFTLWPFVVTYGFATAARDVVYPLVIGWCFGTRYLAQIYGALMLALLPGGALGPIFAAAVHDRSGSYRAAFATFAAMNAASVVALLFVRRETQRP